MRQPASLGFITEMGTILQTQRVRVRVRVSQSVSQYVLVSSPVWDLQYGHASNMAEQKFCSYFVPKQ
jgi:hypothetical protein